MRDTNSMPHAAHSPRRRAAALLAVLAASLLHGQVSAREVLSANGAVPERPVDGVRDAPGILRERMATVDVGAIATADAVPGAGGRLALELFPGERVVGVVRHRAATASGGYALSGGIEGDALGSFVVVVNGDAVAGTVRTRGAVYRLRPAGAGRVAVGELDPGAMPSLEDDVWRGAARRDRDRRTVAADRRVAAPARRPAVARADSASEQVLAAERAALAAFYEATGGDAWDRRANWLGGSPVGAWQGVDVHDDGRVKALSLDGNGLVGALPALPGLARLEQLDVSRNTGLEGELPEAYRRMPALARFDWGFSELCAPRGEAFQSWLSGIDYTGVTCPPDDETVVDVLVAYTPGAVRDVGGAAALPAAVDLMVAETNQAFRTGGAPVRLALVGTVAVDYGAWRTSWIAGHIMLEALMAVDGHMDEVLEERERLAADIVVLVAAGDGGISAGVLEPRPDFERRAFAVVGVSGGRGPEIFAHEVGHLLGLAHERDRVCRDGSCAGRPFVYAHGYVNRRPLADPAAPATARWYTVMAYGTACDRAFGEPCGWLLRYSTPEQEYPDEDGDPMGVPGTRDDADPWGPADAVRVLRRTRETVAKFRAAEALTASLSVAGGATEGGAPAVLTVRLNRAADGTKRFRLAATGAGGASAFDYRVPLRVAVSPGRTEATVELVAVDDAADDDGESVVVELAGLPKGVAAGVARVEVPLVDDDARGGDAAAGPRVLAVAMTSVPPPDVDFPASGYDERNRRFCPLRACADPFNCSVAICNKVAYLAGDRIEFALRFDRHVAVEGAPSIGLRLCRGTRRAAFSEVRGETVYFVYTVGAGDGVANTYDAHSGPCRDLAVEGSSLRTGGGGIRDADGRDFEPAFDGWAPSPAPVVDGAAPTPTEGVAEGRTVVLAWNEELDDSPFASLQGRGPLFSVRVNGRRYDASWDIEVRAVRLELGGDFAEAGRRFTPRDVVTVSYAVPERLPLRDVAGNRVAAFSDFPVENRARLGRDNDADGLIEIATPDQLDAVRHDPDGDGIPTDAGEAAFGAAFPGVAPADRCPGGCAGYELDADIDLDTDGNGAAAAGDRYWNRGAGWRPIDGFDAVFDGNGHAVRGLFVNRPSGCAGLFGGTGPAARIRRLAVPGGHVEGSSAGLVAGCLAGSVEASYATGRVVAGRAGGGLVGESRDGRIARSHAGARVAGPAAGGLAGRIFGGVVEASRAGGDVVADVDGSAGGLVGEAVAGRIAASYAAARVAGGAAGVVVGGGSGYVLDGAYGDADVAGVSEPGAAARTTPALTASAGPGGVYAGWNGGDAADGPWDFRSMRDYPALVADFDRDGASTWQEFGYQPRAAPALEATAPETGGVALRWTALAVDDWQPPPAAAYAVVRVRAGAATVLADGVAGLEHVVPAGDADAGDRYQVAAVVDGGEVARSALVPSPLGADDTAPRVASFTSDAAHPASAPFRVGIAFSEPVSELAAADVVVTGGTGDGLAGGDGAWTLVVTPPADFEGEAVVAVAAGAVRDRAGNASEPASAAFAVDTRAPTLDQAWLSGDVLHLLWHEPLDAASVPAADAFAASGAQALGVTVDGRTVRVEFEAVAGDALAWTYAPPEERALRDRAGNAVAAQGGSAARPPDGSGEDVRLAYLVLTGIDLAFDGERTDYQVDVPVGRPETTVFAGASDPAAGVGIFPADANASRRGHQIRLDHGATVVRVDVVGASARSQRTYTVRIWRQHRPLTARLSRVPARHPGASGDFEVGVVFSEPVERPWDVGRAVVLDGGELLESYATAAESVVRIAPTGTGAVGVALASADGPCGAAGVVCSLDRDRPDRRLANSVSVAVPGPRGPRASAAVRGERWSEGAPVVFAIRLDPPAPAGGFVVPLVVRETGRMLAAAPPEAVDFAPGEGERLVTLATDDDRVVEVDSTVTVGAAPSTGYVAGAAAEALVEDNDVPRAVVTAPSTTLREGETVTLTVAEATGLVFEDNEVVELETWGPALRDLDFTLAREVVLRPGESSTTTPLVVLDDALAEPAEPLSMVALLRGGGVGALHLTIEASPEPTLSVVPALVEEGGAATVSFEVAGGAYAEDRALEFAATGLSAEDYVLEPARTTLAAGTTTATATFRALEDGAAEGEETARIAALLDGAEVASADVSVVDAGPGPRLAGVPQSGGELEAVAGDGAEAEAHEWLRGGEPIEGAAGPRYLLTEGDAGEQVSVRVLSRGRWRDSGPTPRVWPAPASPPLAAGEEELFGATMTMATHVEGYRVTGYSRLPGREFGSVDAETFADGEHALRLFVVNSGQEFGLATSPAVADASDVTAYWDGHAIAGLERKLLDGTTVLWTAPAPEPREVYARHVREDTDGVRVAVSLRRPLPVASVTSSGAVREGAAAVFEVSLDRPAWSALAVGLSATATGGASLAGPEPAPARFPAGERSATVEVATVDDAVATGGGGAVTLTLAAGAGYLLGETTSATAEVEEDDAASWSVTASPAEIDEGGAAEVAVSLADGVVLPADLPIALGVSGTASADDYELAPSLLLRAGTSSASTALRALADRHAEPAETVTVAASAGGETLGAATVSIRANAAPPPAVATLEALSPRVPEGEPAAFLVSLDAPAPGPLAVAVAVSETGAALAGEPPAAVRFAAGERAATLSLATEQDAVVEADSAVTAALAAGAGYLPGTPSSATATVADDDEAEMRLAAAPAEIDEGGTAELVLSVANGVVFAADAAFALAASGTASADDYDLPGSVTLAAGATSARALLTTVDDAAPEPAETVTATASRDGAAAASVTVTIRASDEPSDDARLASLVLSDVDVGAFSPERTAYAGSVAWETSATTVEALPAHGAATVEIADGSGSTLGPRRTVALAEGVNGIAATVTAEDGATLRVYRVSVTRAHAHAWGERLPERDVDLGAGARPTGLWSDGETLWAVRDWRTGSVAAYALAGGAALPDRGFALRDARFAADLWSDGTTLWASDYHGGVTAHRLADGARLPESDLDPGRMAASGNAVPTGLWSDGTTLWVADLSAGKAFAYRPPDGSRAADREFAMAVDDYGTPLGAWGLWSDGATVLAADYYEDAVRGYRLSDGSRLPDLGLELAAVRPMGLWSDGRTLWVVHERETRVHAYAVPGLVRRATSSGPFPVRARSFAARVPSASPGRAAWLPDDALRGRVLAALGKAPGAAVGERELLALTGLDARGAGVVDLTGIGGAANLAALDLGGNPLGDLRPLAELPMLETLNLDGAAAGAAGLQGLQGLRRLSLRGAGVADARTLAGLAGLRVLDLGGNRVADLAPLTRLRALEALRADGNPGADPAALDRLPALRVLVPGGRARFLPAPGAPTAGGPRP